MNQDILLSKIVPNTTETTWSQAYTTLNVYMTLSIENTNSKTPVTSYGKDLLEKLQREFFALDEKSLDQIKKAVSNVIKTIEPEFKYSIIIGAIVKNVLYIVTGSTGKVVLKRDSKIGTIAKGEEGELIGFSGELKHNDIIILQTGDFAEKIPTSSLQDYLASSDVSQIAENITPIIHDGSKGTEAAIILQYKDLSAHESQQFEPDVDTTKNFEENLGDEDIEDSKTPREESAQENLLTKTQKGHENKNIEELDDKIKEEDEMMMSQEKPKKSFKFPSIPLFQNRLTIGILILVLFLTLVGGVFYQKQKQEESKRKEVFEKIYNPAKEKFDNAVSTASVSKAAAIESLSEALKEVDSSLKNFPEGSDEYKRLISLKDNIKKKIAEVGVGDSFTNLKEVIKAGSELKSIDAVTFKGGDIVISSSEDHKVVIIEDSKIKKEFETKDTISYVSSDEKFIYTLGASGITQIDRGNGKTKVVVEDVNGKSLDVFGGNLYTLEKDDIKRYRSPSFEEASYFAQPQDFTNSPVDISISGPIFVLETGGNIERFTRGKKEDFSVKGLSMPFSDNSRIYTDGGFENLYILDLKNQRVVVINNNGEFQKQFEGSFLKNAKSIAIDEKGKIGYIVSNNTLYSFDL